MRQNGVRSNVRFPYASKGMKKGGKAKKQGYKDREDESLGMRTGKESEGMEKAMGRRKYAAVKTMDKGRRKKA